MTVESYRTPSWPGSASRRELPVAHRRLLRDPVIEMMLQQTQLCSRDRALDGLARALADRRGAGRRKHRRRRARVVRLGYNRRAINLQRAARAVADAGRSREPRRGSARARALGSFTGGAVACFAFDAQLTTVDVNARRVLGERSGSRTLRPPAAASVGVEPGAVRPRARRSAWRASPAASAARSPGVAPRAGMRFEALRKRGPFAGSSRARRAAARTGSARRGRGRLRTTMPQRSRASSATGSLIVRDGLVALPEEVTGCDPAPLWATNAIRCLGVVPGERVAVLVDESLIDAGLRVCDAAVTAGAGVSIGPSSPTPPGRSQWRMRPFVASLSRGRCECCSGSGPTAPSEFGAHRYPIYQRAREMGARIAFGAEIDEDILTHEMSADYDAVRTLSAAAGPSASEDGSTCA